MTKTEDLDDLLRTDVDEILDRARDYDSRTRLRLLRAAVEQYDDLETTLARLKAVWLVQAILAEIEDRHLPHSTGADIATRLASIVQSRRDERDARRSALDALALVFLKTKQLTEAMDATIRSAFMSVLKSRDPYLSEFASEALSGEGVLARRSPGRSHVFFSYSQPVDRTHFENVLRQLKARAAAGGGFLKHKFALPAAPRPRKSRRSDNTTSPRSHKAAD
jgi:hypothetical protein